jgi:hypothetical protein
VASAYNITAYNITEDKSKEKWDGIRSYRRDFGKDMESFDNALMSMFGYMNAIVKRFVRW